MLNDIATFLEFNVRVTTGQPLNQGPCMLLLTVFTWRKSGSLKELVIWYNVNVIELVSSIIGSANFQPELVLKLLLRSINLAILKEVLFYSPTSQFIKSKTKVCGFFYRVTRRVFSKSVTSKLHLLFKKNLAGYLKTLKVTRISAMYTNFLHPPVHSGPSKFSRSKIWNWSLGNTKANKNLLND